MKKYEIYKDSGIEWIGEIPEGWHTSKLKFESIMVLGKMLEDKEPKGNKGEYTQEYYLKSRNIGMLEVFTDKDKLDKMWFSDKEKELYLLQKGDLVMNEGGDIGRVALWKPTDFACYIQNSVHKLTPKESLVASFLQYLISYISSTEYFKSVVSAISIAHLTKEKLAETPLLIPPMKEQQAIASYLDHKVGQIDASVSAINAQIDDLKAYRQSIISEAVTKGLNSDVKMKDSGIEGGWSIPVHWSSNRLKFLADIVRGGSPRPIEEYIADEGYNWIKIGDTIKGYKYIESTKEKIKPSGLNATREVHVNDLILSNSMSFGQPYILKIDGCIHDGWLAFTNYKGLDKEYLYYVLQAGVCSCQFEHYVAGGVVQNLNIEKVATTRIPLPPLAEQQSIATYLDKKTSQIDSSIAALEAQRDDLNALKQSIVSEAVTGKIDLRDWKPKN